MIYSLVQQVHVSLNSNAHSCAAAEMLSDCCSIGFVVICVAILSWGGACRMRPSNVADIIVRAVA